MLLASPRGKREVLSWAEVCEEIALTHKQVRRAVLGGQLVKAGRGSFPFHRDDVNQFLHKVNTQQIFVGGRA